MKPMDAAPQASALKAAEMPLLTGFHYPSGKLRMSQELLEHHDKNVVSATKGPVLPCPKPSSCLSTAGFCVSGRRCTRTPVPLGSLIGTLPVPELPQHWHLSPCHMNLSLKQKQSEESQYFLLHTDLQCLV